MKIYTFFSLKVSSRLQNYAVENPATMGLESTMMSMKYIGIQYTIAVLPKILNSLLLAECKGGKMGESNRPI